LLGVGFEAGFVGFCFGAGGIGLGGLNPHILSLDMPKFNCKQHQVQPIKQVYV
jgi:hypothetical protein